MNVNFVTNAKPKVDGAIFSAPLTTGQAALPTDASTALANAYKELGYISDDGWSNDSSYSSDEIKAWGGDTVLTYKSESNDNFTFKLIETLNPDVAKAVYGDSNVTVADNKISLIKKTSEDTPERCWVIDSILRGGVIKRTVIPQGKISSMEEITYADEEVVGYEVTVTAMPYNSNNDQDEVYTGITHAEFFHYPA